MRSKPLSFTDQLLSKIDNGVKTLTFGANQASRPTPEGKAMGNDHEQASHIAGLMRINHCGEVCAQALYQGQAFVAKTEATREAMEEAASEEIDHLAWCEQRLRELNSQPSILNPVFYGLSFGIGAVTGAISDKVSLGFVEATEDQVCQHLKEHLDQIPDGDEKTRAILEQMLEDEQRHGDMALEQGGEEFPRPVKKVMSLIAKAMTKTTYHL